MADLEAVAKWCDAMAVREDAAEASASGADFHSEAREYRRQAAIHRAAAAACRVVAKMKTPGIVRGGGSPVADLEEAIEPEMQALDAALAEIE
jgi:hypothetical protein